MKVALVCDWFLPRIGGIELHLRDLSQRLTSAGHDVVVVTPTPGTELADGVRVRRIDAPRAPHFGFLCTPAGVRAIGEVLADERVDVAHCHVSIVSPAALGGAFQAHRRRIPTVATFHSVVPQTHLLARGARFTLGASQWKARYTAVSERVAREVRSFAGTRPMTVLPNGIDANFWRLTSLRRVDDQLELITVMRLNAKKRPLALVDMMSHVIAMLSREARVRLRIVGDGPRRTALAAAIRRAGLDDHIELLGECDRTRIRELFGESDVFVLPTVRESFGLAALEARCAGLPVVAMASSGVAEVIVHGREGLLAKSDAEFAAHITTLAQGKSLRARIAEHNRETRSRFDWPTVVAAHEMVYRDAIALRNT